MPLFAQFRRSLLFTLLGATAGLTATHAMAQSPWPDRPIRIVVPLAAGGGNDALARRLAEPLSKRLGQPVIVDNRVGAGGNIGTAHVAKSPPDGYTLLLTAPAPIAQAMVLYKKLPYNPQKELTFISDVALPRMVCAVHPSLPVTNAKELLAWAQAHPGKLSIGAWGPGTQPQVVQAFLDKTFGTQSISVPYKGESQVITDLIGAQINMSCATVTALQPHVKAGSVRAIAIIGPTRSAMLPEVPTFAESGYPQDVLRITGPISLLAPAGTPPEVLSRLGREVADIVQTPQMQEQISAMGLEPIGNLPAQAQAGYDARLPIMLKSVRDTGVTID